MLSKIIVVIILLICTVFNISQAKECKNNDGCYQAKFPLVYTITDVKKLGNDLFAVGNDGLILRFHNQQWEKMDSGIERNLKRLWGSSENDIYAVGTFNILHFDGSSWQAIDTPFAKKENWSNIFGIDNEIFVIGNETIIHYKDNKWEKMDSGVSSGNYLNAVWGTSATNLYAVGGSFQDTIIIHYDGDSWKPIEYSGSNWLTDIGGLSADNIYITGKDGLLLHYDGSQWRKITLPQDDQYISDLERIFIMNNKLFFGGRSIVYFDGENFSNISIDNDLRVDAIWSDDSDQILVAAMSMDLENSSMGSSIYQYKNNSWAIKNPKINQVFSLTKTRAYAVGEYGTIKVFDGSQWQTMQSGTKNSINGIWADAEDNVFAVASKGLILHYDGTKWSTMETNYSSLSQYNLNAIWGSSGSDIYAVGNEGSLFHFDGSVWKQLAYNQLNTSENLYAVYGSSATNIYAAGNITLHYDGTAWTQLKLPEQYVAIAAIYVAPDESVYFSTFQNTIYQYSQSKWSEIHYPVKNQAFNTVLGEVYGQSANDMYMIVTIIKNNEEMSSEGFIAHYDGKTWEKKSSFDFAFLTSISGIDGKPLMVSGQNGLLTEYRSLEQSSIENEVKIKQELNSADLNEQIKAFIIARKYPQALELLETLQAHTFDEKRQDQINRLQQYIDLQDE